MKAMNDILVLKTLLGTTRDSSGFRTESYSQKEIFGEIKSAHRSEVYEALRSGIKVAVVAKINVVDYAALSPIIDGKRVRPSRVVYDSTEYEIIRTYQTNDNYIELTLSEVE